jgi:hypothetical protein
VDGGRSAGVGVCGEAGQLSLVGILLYLSLLIHFKEVPQRTLLVLNRRGTVKAYPESPRSEG